MIALMRSIDTGNNEKDCGKAIEDRFAFLCTKNKTT